MKISKKSLITIKSKSESNKKKIYKGLEIPVRRVIHQKAIKPNLDHLISHRFTTQVKRDEVSSFLRNLQGISEISWDEESKILSPIRGYNLIELVCDLNRF